MAAAQSRITTTSNYSFNSEVVQASLESFINVSEPDTDASDGHRTPPRTAFCKVEMSSKEGKQYSTQYLDIGQQLAGLRKSGVAQMSADKEVVTWQWVFKTQNKKENFPLCKEKQKSSVEHPLCMGRPALIPTTQPKRGKQGATVRSSHPFSLPTALMQLYGKRSPLLVSDFPSGHF